jgi:hypothetical protein
LIAEELVKTCWDRIQLLSTFFIFNVALIFFDIGSDTWNGYDFIARGDIFWGSFTLFFSACPFLVRLLLHCLKILIAYVRKDLPETKTQKAKLVECLWFSPFLHPFM